MSQVMLNYDTFFRHAINFGLATISLFVVDHLLIKPFVKGHITKDKEVRQARWFFTHAAANAAVVATGARAMHTLFIDPINAMDSAVYSDISLFGAASAWPLTYINAVHVYHMIGGFHVRVARCSKRLLHRPSHPTAHLVLAALNRVYAQLTGADYFHHLLFVPALGLPGQMLLWGAVEPGGACFISGLPGGISYFMLGLIKLGKMDAMLEKRITANLNCWLRVPGILLSSFVVYQAILYGKHSVPMWPAVLQVVLPFYNSLFYCKQAVANCAHPPPAHRRKIAWPVCRRLPAASPPPHPPPCTLLDSISDATIFWPCIGRCAPSQTRCTT